MQFDFSQISSIDITPIYLFFIISGPDYFRSHNYRLVVLRHVYFATMPHVTDSLRILAVLFAFLYVYKHHKAPINCFNKDLCC